MIQKNTFFLLSIFMILGSTLQASEVSLPQALSTNVCADELLLEVADPQQILALTTFPRTHYQNRLKENPSIQFHHGDLEEFITLQPDIIVTGSFDSPLTSKLLNQFQIKVINTSVPKNFNELIEQIENLGEQLNQRSKAKRLTEEIRKRLRSFSSNAEESKRAVFWGYAGHIPGEETYEHALLQQLGLSNIALDFNIKGHGWISIEQLISTQPDLLFLSQSSNDAVGQNILTHPAIKKALPHLKVVTLDQDSLRCGGIYLLDVLQKIKRELDEK